jgi:DnaJ-class molecular chaperone
MGGFGGAGGASDFSNPFDLFEQFFGSSMGGGFGRSGSTRSRAVAGEDERWVITLT